MGIFNYLRYKKQTEELEEVIVTCWNRIDSYNKEHLKKMSLRAWNDDNIIGILGGCRTWLTEPICKNTYGSSDFKSNLIIMQAEKAVLIASLKDFNEISLMCAELVKKINEVIELYNKMEIQYSYNIDDISRKLNELIIYLKYSSRDVVG